MGVLDLILIVLKFICSIPIALIALIMTVIKAENAKEFIAVFWQNFGEIKNGDPMLMVLAIILIIISSQIDNYLGKDAK